MSTISVRQRKWKNKGKYKVGSAWQVDISFQMDGGPIRKRFNFEGTKVDALDWGERAREALRASKPVPHQGPTEEDVKGGESFDKFAEEFLKTHTVNNKASEKATKESIVRRHLIPFFGAMPLNEIDLRCIDGFTQQLIDVKKLSRKTTHNIRTILRTILLTAVRYDVLKTSPRIKRLKVEVPDIRAFTPEQAQKLLQVIDPAWRTMLLVALHTGLRAGELRGLRWTDVDLFGRKVHVRQSIARKVVGPPKSGRARTVDLTEEAWVALKRHPRVSGGEYVFCHLDGAHLTEGEVYPPFHAACTAAGIGDDSWRPGWHACRHSFVSWLVQEGVPLNVVQKLAGHADIHMTLRYAHLAPSATRDAVARLDGVTKRLSQGTAPNTENTVN